MVKVNDYFVEKLQSLIGGKIVNVISQMQDMGGYKERFYGIHVQMPNGKVKRVLFLRDEEGNGAGGFDILNVPSKFGN